MRTSGQRTAILSSPALRASIRSSPVTTRPGLTTGRPTAASSPTRLAPSPGAASARIATAGPARSTNAGSSTQSQPGGNGAPASTQAGAPVMARGA